MKSQFCYVIWNLVTKQRKWKDQEIAHCLKIYTALAEVMGSDATFTGLLTTIGNFNSERSDTPVLVSKGIRHICGTHTYIYTYIHTYRQNSYI